MLAEDLINEFEFEFICCCYRDALPCNRQRKVDAVVS